MAGDHDERSPLLQNRQHGGEEEEEDEREVRFCGKLNSIEGI